MNSTLKQMVKHVLFLLPVVFLMPDIADCAGQSYHGKNHTAFKNIEIANRRIQPPVESITPEKKAELPETVAIKQPATIQQLGSTRKRVRFVDNGDGTVTDRKTNLMWIKNGRRMEFVSALTWWDAIEKSEEIKVGGHDNWRLPTLEEWRSLIDPNREFPALVEPNPFENIVTHMPYWSRSEFVYGRQHTCRKECPFDSYTVMLYFGYIGHQKKTRKAFILPVRSID
ncbi:DUF1566 domain-containing protein [Thermodesulfobacteriota bacterium]